MENNYTKPEKLKLGKKVKQTLQQKLNNIKEDFENGSYYEDKYLITVQAKFNSFFNETIKDLEEVERNAQKNKIQIERLNKIIPDIHIINIKNENNTSVSIDKVINNLKKGRNKNDLNLNLSDNQEYKKKIEIKFSKYTALQDYSIETDIVFSYFNDIVINTGIIDETELAKHLLKNVYYLKQDYYEYVEAFYAIYNRFPYLSNLLNQLDFSRFYMNFWYCCRLQNKWVRLDIADRRKSMYYILFKLVSYDWVDLSSYKKNELIGYLSVFEDLRNSELTVILESIKKIINERFNLKDFKKKEETPLLTADQIKLVYYRLGHFLFEDGTKVDQIQSLFWKELKVLNANPININTETSFKMFKYFLNEFRGYIPNFYRYKRDLGAYECIKFGANFIKANKLHGKGNEPKKDDFHIKDIIGDLIREFEKK